MKWHNRNASDSVICRKRTQVLVADSKLYSKENTEWLAQTEFITPIPSTNKLETELTMKAVAASEMWCSLPNNWNTMASNNAGLDLILKPPMGGWNRR